MAGTTSGSMLAGIITFFLCEIYALVVAVFGGSLVDILEYTFDRAGFFAVPETWSLDAYTQMVNVFYFTPYIMALLGIVILVVTIWHRHGTDKQVSDEYAAYTDDSEL